MWYRTEIQHEHAIQMLHTYPKNNCYPLMGTIIKPQSLISFKALENEACYRLVHVSHQNMQLH